MNYNSNKNNRSESDVISWIVTALCLWLWPPLGIVFLISKLSRRDFLKKTISKMLDKAAAKKNGFNGGFNSQWGDFSRWDQAPNKGENPNEGSSAQNETDHSSEQDSSSSQSPQTEAPKQSEAPIWAQAPMWGDASKWTEAARRKEAEVRREAYKHSEAFRRRENERQRDDERHGERDRRREAGRAERHAEREKNSSAAEIEKVSKGKGSLLFFGWILFAVGIFSIFEPIFAFKIWQIIQWGAVAAGGGAMLIAAAKKSKKEKEYANYVKIIGGKAYVDIDKIASAVGSKQKEVYKELSDMVERGYFGKAAYIDMASGRLIVNPEAAETDMKEKEPPKPKEQTAETTKDKYDLLLSELHHTCQRVTNATMKGKTEKIESLTEQIFAYVRETPEKESSISSFINYYLPTTLKLINSYADFEAQEFQGQNIIKSRERIETAADTIIQAYERQLDNLFLIDTIDVSSDINVLENMMKRDGLSGTSDFGSSMPLN